MDRAAALDHLRLAEEHVAQGLRHIAAPLGTLSSCPLSNLGVDNEAHMNGDAPLSWLMFFTLAAGVIVVAGFFLQFLRSRHNRAVAASALGGEHHSRRGEPDGAGVELVGLFVVAVVAMALLAFGYHSHSGSTVREVSGPNNELANGHNDPNSPKTYQPQNPAPDDRSAPTGSSTGAGPNSGGHPEASPKQ